MKRLFVLLVLGVFLSFVGCSNQSVRLDQLEKKVAELEDEMLMGGAGGIAANFYPAHLLTGGAAGALDKITSTENLDVGIVVLLEDGTYGNAFFPYVLDVDAAGTEAVPSIIDSGDAGNEDWELCKLYGEEIIARTSWGPQITGAITLGDELTEVWNKLYLVSAACTVTLAKASTVGYGATVGFYVRDTTETLIIEIDNADKINLHGTPLDAGDTIDSPGNVGDFIFLVATTDADGAGTDGWLTFGYGKAVWTDGGAS